MDGGTAFTGRAFPRTLVDQVKWPSEVALLVDARF